MAFHQYLKLTERHSSPVVGSMVPRYDLESTRGDFRHNAPPLAAAVAENDDLAHTDVRNRCIVDQVSGPVRWNVSIRPSCPAIGLTLRNTPPSVGAFT